MRWTLVAHKTNAQERTAKSWRPDISILISGATRERCYPWWQESPITRETTKETVKTIARGMPGVPV